MTSSNVEKVDIKNDVCKVNIKTDKGLEIVKLILFVNLGIQANIEGIGLEDVGIKTDKAKFLLMVLTEQILMDIMQLLIFYQIKRWLT